MSRHKKISLIAIGALVLTLALGLVAFAPVDTANAAAPDGGFTHGRAPGSFRPIGTDDAALADALDISVEELQAAHETVKAAALEQAVADGKITEEQAAMMEAHQVLESHMQKDEMTANALGITVDELNAAQEDGQRLPDLIEALGITQEEFEANMQALREETLQQAVQDGVITQEQADLMFENGYHGLHDLDGTGSSAGRRSFEHPEGFPRRPDNDGTNFQDLIGPTIEG